MFILWSVIFVAAAGIVFVPLFILNCFLPEKYKLDKLL